MFDEGVMLICSKRIQIEISEAEIAIVPNEVTLPIVPSNNRNSCVKGDCQTITIWITC